MEEYKIFYQCNLPHFQPIGYSFFVTFRLTGSLPLYIIKKLKNEGDVKLKEIAEMKSINERFIEYKKY